MTAKVRERDRDKELLSGKSTFVEQKEKNGFRRRHNPNGAPGKTPAKMSVL